MLINRNRATANEFGRLFKWTINWHCNEVSNFHCLLAVLLFANKFLWCLSPVPTNTILWFHFGYFAPLRRSVTVALVHLVSLQPVFHSYKSWFSQVGCYDGCDSRLRVSTMSRYSLFTRPPVFWMHQALMEHLPFQPGTSRSPAELRIQKIASDFPIVASSFQCFFFIPKKSLCFPMSL